MANNFGRVNVSITASTGGLTAGLSSASKQLKGFSSTVGKMSGVMGSLRGSMGMLLPVFGGFATAGGAIAALTSATNAAGAVHDLSQELGVAGSDLQVLQQVARETGASQESMTVALRRTTRMVGELAQGTPSAVKAFAQLGLSMRDMNGLSVAQQFSLIADRISALPPQMQAAAAVDIFGRSGQGMLNFLRQVQQVTPEVERLQRSLGVALSRQQLANIESMGDAVGRMAMPMQGFINQLLAGLAPAITAVSQILMEFFASSNDGFSFATTLANALIATLKWLVIIGSSITGVFQILRGVLLSIGAVGVSAFGMLSTAIGNVLQFIGELVPGLASIGKSIARFGGDTQLLGNALGDQAAQSFEQAIANFENPLQGFDQKMAEAQQQAAAAAVRPLEAVSQAAGQTIGDQIKGAIAASSAALKAIVVGSSEGEAFRNSILRGADPRNDGAKDGARTADATERTADAVEELAGAMGGGMGLAEIGV